jgi:hypothetical protein
VAGTHSIYPPLPVTFGTYAFRPSAGWNGRIYTVSDGPVALWVDDGAAWRPLVNGMALGTQPKVAATFTRFNNGTSNLTLTDVNGGLHIKYPIDGSVTDIGGFTESLSSTTAHVEAAFIWNFARTAYNASSFPGVGVCMRESSTGKVFTVGIAAYNDTVGATGSGMFMLEGSYWANASTRTASSGGFDMPRTGALFLRAERSGSNMLARFSTDGQTWTTFYTIATTVAFTANPDSVGIFAQVWNATDGVDADVVSYNSGS